MIFLVTKYMYTYVRYVSRLMAVGSRFRLGQKVKDSMHSSCRPSRLRFVILF